MARWASHEGAEVTFIGCVGFSDADRVTKEFESFGVHAQLQTSEKSTGSIVVMTVASSSFSFGKKLGFGRRNSSD